MNEEQTDLIIQGMRNIADQIDALRDAVVLVAEAISTFPSPAQASITSDNLDEINITLKSIARNIDNLDNH